MKVLFIFGVFFFIKPTYHQPPADPAPTPKQGIIKPGAERMEAYLPLLRGKKVAVFANHTSRVGSTHLVDTLVASGVDIRVIFSPEHGFRGKANAGEKVNDTFDELHHIKIISLYGKKNRPGAEELADVDVILFDIQDLGVRFFTYISSLEELLEAALEFHKPLILLDRPNPNGFYVDGPVLERSFRSFVGRQPVPIVYGMTLGEYAQLITGEHWLSEKANQLYDQARKDQQKGNTALLLVINCENYTHTKKYRLPVPPSPNLPDMASVYLYPSTCLFEGTSLSEGRGTDRPFQWIGHPDLPRHLASFAPQPTEAAKSSKHYGKVCYGWDRGGSETEVLQRTQQRIQINWLIEAYRLFPDKDQFFLYPQSGKKEECFFNKLAGNDQLRQQILNGVSVEEIRKSWQPQLQQFKLIRKKYLLYPDFE